VSKSETNWGVQGSQQHTPAEVDEHAIISGVHGKKVFAVDSSGNHIDIATEDNQTNGDQIAQASMKTGDATFQIPRLDVSTHAQNTIDYAHHEIHSGSSYTACRVVTHGLGEPPNILLTAAGTAKRPHFVFHVISDDLMVVNLYEAPDYSGGTSMTAFNRDRNSGNTAGLALAYDATDDSGGKGTLIWTFKGGANKTVTASESGRFEFILDEGVKYLLEAVGANGDNITFLLDWYEHTNKTA